MNSIGTKFRISVFGESHGTALGMVADGVPAGMELRPEDFAADLARRKWGEYPELRIGTTPRKESDEPVFLSGVLDGKTTGAPVTIIFRNCEQHSKDYENLRTMPRPGHSDFVAQKRFNGFNDIRGGGHFSGRLTLNLIAAGVIAKKMLALRLGDGISVSGSIREIGGSEKREEWQDILLRAIAEKDSVGGVVECRAAGIPIGLGEPFFDSLEAKIAHIAFSVPGVKGIEFGCGFGCAGMKGSEYNDPIIDAEGKTSSNNTGGINGGMSNGNPIVFRMAVRPTASIAKEQRTINLASGKVEPLEIRGRHDVCIALRCPVIAEAVAAIALADSLLTE